MESRAAGEKRDDTVDDSERVTNGLIAALALAIVAMLLGGCSNSITVTRQPAVIQQDEVGSDGVPEIAQRWLVPC